MANIGSMSVTLRADTNAFTRGLAAARKALARFAKSVSSTIFSLKGLGIALTGGALVSAAKATLDWADSLDEAAQKIGLNVSRLHELQYAAQLSGVQTDTLNAALTKMSVNLTLAAQAAGPAQTQLARLGLDAARLARMAPDQQFLALADAISKLGTQGQQSAAAMAIFGKSGAELVPLLQQGSAGVMQFATELQNLGGALSKDAAAQAAAANDALDRMATTVRTALTNAIVALAPTIEWIATGIAEFVSHRDSLQVMVKVAEAIAAAFLGVKFILTAMITGLVQLLDDLAGAIQTVVNLVPGVETEMGSKLDGLRSRLEASTRKSEEDFTAGLTRVLSPTTLPTPAAAAPAAAKTSEAPRAFSGIKGALGGLLESGKLKAQRFALEKGFQAQMLGRFGSFMASSMLAQANAVPMARLNNASIGATDATSREGFAARVRAMRADPQLRIQRDQLKQLRDIAANTKDMGGVAAGFA